MKCFRYTVNNIGIYEAFKNECSFSEWQEFKQSIAAKWLPIPNLYKTNRNCISLFTERGNQKFIELTLPIFLEKLDKSSIKKKKF